VNHRQQSKVREERNGVLKMSMNSFGSACVAEVDAGLKKATEIGILRSNANARRSKIEKANFNLI
jgi:hypothetical protein